MASTEAGAESRVEGCDTAPAPCARTASRRDRQGRPRRLTHSIGATRSTSACRRTTSGRCSSPIDLGQHDPREAGIGRQLDPSSSRFGRRRVTRRPVAWTPVERSGLPGQRSDRLGCWYGSPMRALRTDRRQGGGNRYRCWAGRHTPWPRNLWAIAQAMPVARCLAIVECGPVQPPSAASWRIWSHSSNNSGVNRSRDVKWLRTIPGKSWFPILRHCGPLEAWFDQTWQPGEIQPA